MTMTADIAFTYILSAIVFTEASHLCVNPDSVNHMRINQYLVGNVFQTFSESTFMRCGKKCLKRSFCKSFNFDTSSLVCSLRNETSADSVIETSSTEVFSDIQEWPSRLVGICVDHNCNLNEFCLTRNEAPSCRAFGCLEPPTIAEGVLDLNGKMLWLIGDEQAFTCVIDYKPVGKLTCLAGGSWSDVSCTI